MSNLAEEIEVLQKKYDMAAAYITTQNEERDKLCSRMDDIDAEVQEADGDMRRLNKAMNALRGDDDAPVDPERITARTVPTKQSGLYPMGNLEARR